MCLHVTVAVGNWFNLLTPQYGSAFNTLQNDHFLIIVEAVVH
jgi:hypothetical protein